MRNLRGIVFLGTIIAFILNSGELLAQASPLESSQELGSDLSLATSPSSLPISTDSAMDHSSPTTPDTEPVQSVSVPLQNIVTTSVELAANTVLEPSTEASTSVELADNAVLTPSPEVTPSEAEIQTPKQPQPLSEFEVVSPSTQAHDLSMNWMDQVEWEIAQAQEQPSQAPQQENKEREEEEDPRKAADARGRRLSNNYNYIGVGGNVGIAGDASGLGNGGFMTLSKTGFSENVSLHGGGVVFSGDGASLTHLTFDFPVRTETGSVKFAPFIGAGVIYKDLLDKDFSFGPSATVGIDIPISYSFLITSRATVGYIRDETDFGIQFGFTYIYTRGLLDIIF